MIPDKLYAKIVAGILHASTEPHKVFGEEYPEYIRKDALLTWLNDVENIYNKETDGNPGADCKYYCGMCEAFEMVVEKLNKM